MPTGYILGCFISILLWKLDRVSVFQKFNGLVRKLIRNRWVVQAIYLILIFIICFFLRYIKNKLIYDFVTALIVIDISSTERKNLIHNDKFDFYNSISIISNSIICGFVAPLLFIILFGNVFGVLFTLIYWSSSDKTLTIFRILNSILIIVPCFLTCILFYMLYVYKNKKFDIHFAGDYLKNTLFNPLLNIDILAAYIEGVNFYCYGNDGKSDYIKSYGKSSNSIDIKCVKHYIGVGYCVYTLIFFVFFVIKMMKIPSIL